MPNLSVVSSGCRTINPFFQKRVHPAREQSYRSSSCGMTPTGTVDVDEKDLKKNARLSSVCETGVTEF